MVEFILVEATPTQVAFAFDFNNRKFWVNNLMTGSGWNGDVIARQDPATGTGGYSFGALAPGPYFIMISVGSGGDYVVLNPGRTPFVGALPSGYSAWGPATTLNAADIGASATLAAPVAHISGVGYANWAKWRSLGYDQHGLNADPLFVDAAAEDFRLSSTSPAIAAGVTLPMVTTDCADTPRPQNAGYDIGAHAAPI
jgi:hypothetical protein